MTERERFHRTMHFDHPDRVPYGEIIGIAEETLQRWRGEGLPVDVHPDPYFGFDRREDLRIALDPVPSFPVEVISEDADYRVEQGADGVWRRFGRRGEATYQFVRFPLRSREDWQAFRKRLNPSSPCRYPMYWEDRKRTLEGRAHPLFIRAGSVYGWLRDWMGLEGISMALYDDESWVAGMMEEVTDFIVATLAPAVEQVPGIDYAILWEDMAGKNGPFLSPAHFRRLMVPQYRRITGLLRSHGIDTILVDCDGNHDSLNDLWLEAGVNGVHPLEVAAGEDPVALRKRYGKDLLLIGGIDKRALARGPRAIEEEVMGKAPYLLEQGGWMPSVDHAVPADVSFANYRYYLDLMARLAEGR
jgi:uroporphyrinogen decarboxylase